MSKSKNSRKGSRNSKRRRSPHRACFEGKNCSYCNSNFTHASDLQRLKNVDPLEDDSSHLTDQEN